MPVPIARVDAGVDYITCTYNAEANLDLLAFMVHRTKRQEVRAGNRVHSFGMSGYRGEKVGGLEFGTRHDGTIVRLSGFSAQRWWKRFGKLATNCSRIDLQQTMVYDEPWLETTARHWQEMLEWHLAGSRRPKPKAFVGPTGCETIYSGERVSDVYLRLYHRGSKKGLEQFQGHVRYEVELKADKSWTALQNIVASRVPEEWMFHQVAAQFGARGCSLEWSNIECSRIRGTLMPSDSRRRLAWIRRSVQPAVQNLIELGHRAEVLDALGLSALLDSDLTT